MAIANRPLLPAFIALGLLVGAVNTATADPREQSSVLIRGVPNGLICSQGASTIAEARNQITLSCDQPTSVISCDAPDFEPIDVRTEAVCAARALPLTEAVEVIFRSRNESNATIEWLSIRRDGELIPVATRSVLLHGATKVRSSVSGARILRILRPGASPVSIPSSRWQIAPEYAVPDAVAGGELLVTMEPAAIEPVEFDLLPVSRRIEASETTISTTGLFPGRYELVPVFVSGVRGRPIQVGIEAQSTASVYFTPGNVGAATITQASDSCVERYILRLAKLMPLSLPSSRATEILPMFAPEAHDCRWIVSGLQPGKYLATSFLRDDQLDSVEFEVRPQQITVVSLGQPRMLVSGTVTLNGKPAAGRDIQFIETGTSTRISATTDAEGHYGVAVPNPGIYIVMIQGWSQSKQLHIKDIETQFDWAISGAALTVVLNGATETTTLEVRRAFHEYLSTRRLPLSEKTYTFVALPFGTFSVSARSKGAASDAVSVTLSANEPERSITLTLRSNAGSMVIWSEDGMPMSGLRFPGIDPPPEETAPGVYSVAGISAGTELRIRPGAPWAPVCVLVAVDTERTVVLRRGELVTMELLRLERWETGRDFGTLLGVPGSECGVRLSDFAVVDRQLSSGRIVLNLSNYLSGAQSYLLPTGKKLAILESRGSVMISKN